MRTGVGAEFPHHDRYSGVRSTQQAVALYAPSAQHVTTYQPSHKSRAYQSRANIARLFFDLRHALRARPHDVAAHLQAAPETIAALEAGQFEFLPPWPETVRVVMAYTALASIDGRPVLSAIADVLTSAAAQAETQVSQTAYTTYAQPALIEHAEVSSPASPIAHGQRSPVAKWKQAGSALAHGAKRLPAGALNHMRQRPDRAFYAVSLPLGILLLLLNTSALQAAFSHVPRPVARLAQDVRHFFQEQFAPVHEGLRWIDVDDPRRRRGDKLR